MNYIINPIHVVQIISMFIIYKNLQKVKLFFFLSQQNEKIKMNLQALALCRIILMLILVKKLNKIICMQNLKKTITLANKFNTFKSIIN